MSANRIITLGKDTVVYGFGGIVSKFLNIFLLPVLTRLFSVEEFGTIDLIALIITFFNAVCILGMDSAIGVYYFEQDTDEKKKSFFSSYFWTATVSSAAFALIGILLAPYFAQAVLKDPQLVGVFRIACLTIPATIIFQALITLSRFQFRPKAYNLLVILNVALNVVLAILLVKYLSMHIVGIFWARVIAASFIIAGALVFQFQNIGLGISGEKVKRLVLYGLPLIPLALITYASNAMGRYFLKFYWTDFEIGKYAFAVKISAICGVAFTAFNLAFLPYASKLRFEGDFHETVNKIVKLFLFVSGALILFLYSLSNPLIRIFGTREYLTCEPFMVLGMLALFLNAAYQIFNIGVCYAKKTVYITISQGAAVLTNLVSNFVLVPHYGVLGAFMSLIISLVLANLTIFAISQSVYPIRYQTQKIVELFMLIVFIGVASFWVRDPFLKLAILMTYGIWGLSVRKYITLPNISEFGVRLQNIKDG